MINDNAGNNNDEKTPNESAVEDPIDNHTEKDHTPSTVKKKEIARMLISFCHLPKPSANAIVVHFGMSRMNKLADFYEEQWKDKFVWWQKFPSCPNGLD